MAFITGEEIANVLMAVIFISSLIGTLFFTLGARLEKKVVDQQVKSIIDDILRTISILDHKNILGNFADKIEKPDLSEADKKVAKANKKLMINAAILIASLLVVGLVVCFALSKIFKFSFLELLRKNLIILVFIAITEILFLYFIGTKYIGTDSNFIKKVSLYAIKKV